MERVHVNPILTEELFVEEENRNFISEFVEPLLVAILLNVNGLQGHLTKDKPWHKIFMYVWVPKFAYFCKVDFTKFLQSIITKWTVILEKEIDSYFSFR